MISRRLSLALVATAALVSTAFQPCVAQTAQTFNPQSVAPRRRRRQPRYPAFVPFSGTHNRTRRQARLRRDRHYFPDLQGPDQAASRSLPRPRP